MIKSNEITAIPCLLRQIDLRKSVVTIDAMGSQTDITDVIIAGRDDYCLAVKGNQGNLHEAIDLYFSDAKLLSKLTERGCHYQTIEKAHRQIEARGYWVSHDVKWLSQRHPRWKRLSGIGMTKTTIDKDGGITEEGRYFILSFKGMYRVFLR